MSETTHIYSDETTWKPIADFTIFGGTVRVFVDNDGVTTFIHTEDEMKAPKADMLPTESEGR